MAGPHDPRITDLLSADGADLAVEASAFLRTEAGFPGEGAGGRGGSRARILLPYVDSEPAKHALESTIQLSTLLHSEVRIIHVREWSPCRGGRLFLETREESFEVTSGAVDRLRRCGVRASGVIGIARRASVPCVIVDEAKAFNAGTIILGARQRRFLWSALMGSTSLSVMRRASCPVLLVHPPRGPRGPTRGYSVGDDPREHPDTHRLAA